MRRSTSRWIVGVAVGGILHIGIFWSLALLVPRDVEVGSKKREEAAKVAYIGSNSGDLSLTMQQQIELFDPKPLMQPTSWNTANFDRVGDYVEADLEIFVDYQPIYGSEDGEFVSVFGNTWSSAGSVEETILGFPLWTTRQIGRVAAKTQRLAREGVELEVVRMRDGTTVFEETFYNNVADEILKIPGSWGIASFIVQVVDSFQVGRPSIDQSTGNSEADSQLSNLIVLQLLPKGLLTNGFFHVKVAR
ncbi:MAG TPA: hypothetical protein DCS60_06245 [Opitutae bacterium]|nr:hypothetical protein [Opitutae bacterium]|tara:strand:+ start:265 stop:1008 length:744 start_codon:yes stop_codon:yes gene_type:complete